MTTIGIIDDHNEALSQYLAAGYDFPDIPDGDVYVWHHFRYGPQRQPGVVINVRGDITLLCVLGNRDFPSHPEILERAVEALLREVQELN